jgi:glycosyltransferase involved in cell wall biosynthesis
MIAPKAYPLFNPEVKGVFGGAEVDLYYLGGELAKDPTFEVSFVVADYGQKDLEVADRIKIFRSFDFKQNPLKGMVKIWWSLNRVNADIYLIKSISPGVILLAAFCLLKRKKFVYRTAHSTHCDGTYLKKHPVMGRLFRRILKSADLVLVQNLQDRENLKKTTGVDSIVIRNGHRIDDVSKVERDTILWVGRSAAFKQPWIFIELAREMAGEHFVMICQQATGDNKYSELSAKAEDAENIEFIERVPFDKINEYFQRAKVFVNTSDAEGFPNTFIQACLARTPILSLNVNPDRFLDKYKCGLCAEGNGNKFVDGLKILLDPVTAGQYGENGLKYARRNHDITKIAAEYKKLFIDIAAKP